MTQLQLEAIVADEEEVLNEIKQEVVSTIRDEYGAKLEQVRTRVLECIDKYESYVSEAIEIDKKHRKKRIKELSKEWRQAYDDDSELREIYSMTGNTAKANELHQKSESLRKEIERLKKDRSDVYHRHIIKKIQADLPDNKNVAKLKDSSDISAVLTLYRYDATKDLVSDSFDEKSDNERVVIRKAYDYLVDTQARMRKNNYGWNSGRRDDVYAATGVVGGIGLFIGSLPLSAVIPTGILVGGVLPAAAAGIAYSAYRIAKYCKKRVKKKVLKAVDKEWKMYKDGFIRELERVQ